MDFDGEMEKAEKKNGILGNLLFFIDAKYLFGSRAKYLKEGSIVFTNPEDGPVSTSFNWSESNTDLLQINFGLAIKIN